MRDECAASSWGGRASLFTLLESNELRGHKERVESSDKKVILSEIS